MPLDALGHWFPTLDDPTPPGGGQPQNTVYDPGTNSYYFGPSDPQSTNSSAPNYVAPPVAPPETPPVSAVPAPGTTTIAPAVDPNAAPLGGYFSGGWYQEKTPGVSPGYKWTSIPDSPWMLAADSTSAGGVGDTSWFPSGWGDRSKYSVSGDFSQPGVSGSNRTFVLADKPPDSVGVIVNPPTGGTVNAPPRPTPQSPPPAPQAPPPSPRPPSRPARAKAERPSTPADTSAGLAVRGFFPFGGIDRHPLAIRKRG